MQGLYAPNRTANPLDAPVAFRLGAVSSIYTDANGQKITNILDQSGQIISSSDEVGLLPKVKRNDDNLVVEQTDARGNITSSTYDQKGNTLSIQDSLSFLSPGGNTLIVNRGSDSRTTSFFTGILQAAGITTTVVANIPTSLSGFNQVLDIRSDNQDALTAGDRSLYLSFLQTGGKVFLTGENRNFVTRNNSLISLVQEAGGGSLTFTEPRFVQQAVAPFNGPNLISDGNVTYGGIATGGVTSAGTGKFVSVDTNGVGSAIKFSAGNLSNAANGELTVIFDSNFFTDAGDLTDNQNLVRNLVGFERVAKRFTYDAKFSQVTSYTDELGHQKLYQIDQNNGNLLSLTQVVGAVGGDDDLVSSFTYTDKGLVDLITDPLGRITDSDYDARGRLSAITYAKGTVDEAKQQFEYDAAGNQTAIIDENGNTTRFEYDALSRLVKITEADPDGAGTLISPVTNYAYDADGNLVSTTDALGRVTQNFYDKLDRLTESIDALNQKTTYSYDALGNLLTAIDALGRKTENKYDARSRIVETIAPDLGSTRFAYDLSDNIISRTNAIGNATTISYDARNRLTGEIDALGKATRYQYDAANNLIAQTDRNGNSTRYQYDDLDRRIQTQDALNRTTSNIYDTVNNLVSSTDELGRITKYTYDNRNRQKTVIDPLNGITTFGYDLVGNLKTITDELNRTTTYNYDALNRRISVSDPLNQITRTAYDAVDKITSVTDALNQTTRYEYDVLDRRVKVTDAKAQVTTTAYDAVGNILSVTDPVGNKTSYTFDVNDRLTSETNALGKTASYQYDFVGNQLAAIDRNGRTRRFSYDKLNRQIGEQWLNASGNSISDTTYTYDAIGNLLTASDPNSKYTYVYDVVNRLTSTDNKDTAGVPNVLLHYTYDAADNLLKVTDTIGGQLKGSNDYIYDALNRATSLTQSGNGVSEKRVDISYDAASQTTGLSRFADIAGLIAVASTVYDYDANGRLTNLAHRRNGNNLAVYGYAYDAINRITQTTSSTDGTSNFTYDATNQLTSTDHSFQTDEAYSFDANGNRTNTGYSTGVNNQLLSDGAYTYEYDGEGNRTKRTETASGRVTEYVWDYRNRLTKVSFKDAAGSEVKSVDYIYDVDNRRIAKIIDADGAGAAASTTERYVYDGQNIILSFDGGGTQTHRYFYGTGVDQVLADENTQGRVLWTLTDNQGTVRDLIDSAGIIQNHITYDSFGKITSQTNSSISTIFGYTGREYDAETEQYYYRARYYDQNIGRFISEDPIGFAAGDSNIYRYVGNSPTNFVDPLGLECECSGGGQPSLTNRIFGGLRAIGGAFQAAGGVSLAVAGTAGTAGIGAAPAIIGGGLIAARGADDFQAGIRQLFTGQETNSLTFDGVKNLTGNCKIAGAVDLGTGLISAGGAVKGLVSAADAVQVARNAKLLEEANFAQKTFGKTFSETGKFAGKTIDNVADALSSGKLKPKDVPIEFIKRDGNTLILNTRSSQALEQAGIPRSKWYGIDKTGNVAAEERLTGQLARNKLTSEGTSTVRPTNKK